MKIGIKLWGNPIANPGDERQFPFFSLEDNLYCEMIDSSLLQKVFLKAVGFKSLEICQLFRLPKVADISENIILLTGFKMLNKFELISKIFFIFLI